MTELIIAYEEVFLSLEMSQEDNEELLKRTQMPWGGWLASPRIVTSGIEVYAEKYAEDQAAFFKDYAESHAKLSELGAKFDPPEGFSIDEPPQPAKQPVPEKFVAAKYSSKESDKKELSDEMKAKIRAEYLAVGGSPDQPLKTNNFLNIMLLIGALALLTSIIVNKDSYTRF
ncbi:hypothetical protein L7F22_049559 [Adiantum nelumboides]|nr:hypothetical protein [Adiantum nelumboides]